MNDVYTGTYRYAILPLNFKHEFVDDTTTKISAVVLFVL